MDTTDPENPKCSMCNDACLTCSGSLITECDSCKDGFWFDGSSTCDACDPKCVLCDGDTANDCSKCAEGFYLIDGGTTC